MSKSAHALRQVMLTRPWSRILTPLGPMPTPTLRPHGPLAGAWPHSVILGLCKIGDVAGLTAALLLGRGFANATGAVVAPASWAFASTVGAAACVLMLRFGGSYRMERLTAPLTDVSCVLAAVTVGMVVQAGGVVVLDPQVQHQLLTEALTAWGAAASICLLGQRLTVGVILGRACRLGRLTRRVAVVGANDVAAIFVERSRQDRWTHIAGVYDDRPDSSAAAQSGLFVTGPVQALVEGSRYSRVDAVVLAVPGMALNTVSQLHHQVGSVVGDLAVVADGGDFPAAMGAISLLSGNAVVVLSRQPMQGWPGVAKACFDRAVGAFMLLSLLPFMLMIAAAIKLDSRGPALFLQKREGFNNRLFTMFKFRTMKHGRPVEDEDRQATRRDERVTRVGAVLRRFSLDELPQLVNVIRGEMSLVGPRPHLPTTRVGDRLLCELVPTYPARHRVKPGITGLAQVNGLRGETRTEQQVFERVSCDLRYIRDWSLTTDIRILGMTVVNEVVSRSGNAY